MVQQAISGNKNVSIQQTVMTEQHGPTSPMEDENLLRSQGGISNVEGIIFGTSELMAEEDEQHDRNDSQWQKPKNKLTLWNRHATMDDDSYVFISRDSN